MLVIQYSVNQAMPASVAAMRAPDPAGSPELSAARRWPPVFSVGGSDVSVFFGDDERLFDPAVGGDPQSILQLLQAVKGIH